jgi:hypothetical protein
MNSDNIKKGILMLEIKSEVTENMQKLCQHYWIIGTPDSEMNSGRCKYCGETREFLNIIEGNKYKSKPVK